MIDSKTASGNPLLIPSCLEVNGFDIIDQALLMDKVQHPYPAPYLEGVLGVPEHPRNFAQNPGRNIRS